MALIFLDTWQGWIRHLTSPEHSKSQSKGCRRIGDAHPVVLVIPGYAPWKQISNRLTLVSTQLGNTLKIENTDSTSWKPLHSSSGLARDDDDDTCIALDACIACSCAPCVMALDMHHAKLLAYKMTTKPHGRTSYRKVHYCVCWTWWLKHCVMLVIVSSF